jgi:hypothetical protein
MWLANQSLARRMGKVRALLRRRGSGPFLAVAAIFKNEEHILREWIEHYRSEGAKRIYLCDDRSSDGGLSVIEAYARAGIVALMHVPSERRGMQPQEWFLSEVLLRAQWDGVDWLLVCDLDEFVSVRGADETLVAKLRSVYEPAGVSEVRIPWLMFGSNGHRFNPASAVEAFTRRLRYTKDMQPWTSDGETHDYRLTERLCKHIVKPRDCKELNVHRARLRRGVSSTSSFGAPGTRPPKILLEENIEAFQIVVYHLFLQSEQFWRDVKCTRGDVMGRWTRTMESFVEANERCNEVEDTSLRDRKRRASGHLDRDGRRSSLLRPDDMAPR